MYLVAIAWMYVVVMMSVAEATSPTGTVLGAVMTFFLYGILPCVILMYLMGTPMRKRANRAKEQAELEQLRAQVAAQSGEPNTGREPTADAITPVRKEL
jgi:uncharacterized membrane protein